MTPKRLYNVVLLAVMLAASAYGQTPKPTELCLDAFCIGQSIQDRLFSETEWIIPKDARQEHCGGIGCQPKVAFRGYSADEQRRLQDAVSLIYGLGHYSILTKKNLKALREYKYECNLSQRGFVGGERRFSEHT